MFNNEMFNQFGSFQNFMQRLNGFKRQMDQNGNSNYEQIVQNLINTGQMSQEQFNQFRNIANQITGKNL